MLKDTFQHQMRILDDRFNRGKPSPPSTMEVYWDKLKRIPDQAFRDIIEKLVMFTRVYPTPGDMLSLWAEWQKDHPDVMVKKEQQYCEHCTSKGYFDIEVIPKWIRDNPQFQQIEPEEQWEWAYGGVCNCAHCKSYPFARRHVRAYFKEQIEGMEWTRIIQPRAAMKNKQPAASVEEAAANVGKEQP